MRFKGRVITFLLVFFVNSLYITYYYIRDGFISWMEYVGLPILLSTAWWFGKQYDMVKYYSEKDSLTGIYNRRFVEFQFPKIQAMSEGSGRTFAILLLDVNDFKIINDQFGHKAGDDFLKDLANQLERSVRSTDIVARWGGDEFMILLQDFKEKEKLDEIIHRIHQNLKTITANDFEITVSIGKALYPSEGRTFDDLVRNADKNMYELKSKKNQQHYSPHDTAYVN